MANSRLSQTRQRICHFLPSKHTCLAYDSEIRWFAVGCETGEIAVVQDSEVVHFSHHEKSPVQLMSFAVGKGLLLTVLKDKPTVFLWNLNKKPVNGPEDEEEVKQLYDKADPSCTNTIQLATCITWSNEGYYYVGTNTGTIYTLGVHVHDKPEEEGQGKSSEKEEKTEPSVGATSLEMPYKINWSSDSISTISESNEPLLEITELQERRKSKSSGKDKVLVVYSSGQCVVWKPTADGKKSLTENEEKILTAWWTSNGKKVLAEKNGTIRGDFSAQLQNTFYCKLYDCEGEPSLNKIKQFGDRWLVFSGGNKPEKRCHESRILSLYDRTSDTSKPFAPFGSKIVDFEFMKTEKDEPAFAVLTENELIISLENLDTWKLSKPDVPSGTSSQIQESEDPGKKYIRITPCHAYPYITAPVTSLKHCGYCKNKYLIKMSDQSDITQDQEMKDRAPPHVELIVTGHHDGSVRLWLSSNVEWAGAEDIEPDGLELDATAAMDSKSYRWKRGTAHGSSSVTFKCALVVYTADFFDETSQLNDDYFEITVLKMSSTQKFMTVVNKYGQVLLFNLRQQTAKQKPQSQEVILKEDSDRAKLLSTPPPKLQPCEWQTHVQLDQHFTCYYHREGNQELELKDLVQVTCVDYNEQMGLFSVGTSKGLMVLNRSNNTLVEVIGSEEKMFELSGLQTYWCDLNNEKCDVMCVETVPEIKLTQSTADQCSLWVAANDKALGVFTLESNDSENVLRRTDQGKIKSTKIVDILYCKLDNDDTCVVLITQKEIKSYMYPGKRDHKCTTDGTIVKSGIFSNHDDELFVISLVSKKSCLFLEIRPLFQLSETNRMRKIGMKENDIGGNKLFSSGGQHAVWCSSKAVIYYKPFDEGTKL